MLNLLPGDRLWNRFRVEEAGQHGAEGAWLSLLSDTGSGQPSSGRYLLLPLSPAHPLTNLLAVVGSGLRQKLVAGEPPKLRRARKSKKPEPPAIPQQLPLIGQIEWIGEPGRDGVAVVSAPKAARLSRIIEDHGALNAAQTLLLIQRLTEAVQQLVVLLSTSRRPLSVPQEFLKALAGVLHPDGLALRTDQPEPLLFLEPTAQRPSSEPPPWADYIAPEAYRGDDLTPSSLVFSIARLSLYLLNAVKISREKSEYTAWAALSEFAAGRKDFAREFAASQAARDLPAPVVELLTSALARHRSARLSSPEKLLARLQHPEIAELIQGPRCLHCGFIRSETQSACVCCGNDRPLASASGQFPARQSGTARIRRGNTTSILKTKSAITTAVLPKIEGMTLIEAGAFLSGEDRTPRTLRAFAIDTVPVTEGDYKRYLQDAGKTARLKGPGTREPAYDKHPVTGVTWYEANEYAEHYGKRLPTIFEWEKAARGTDGRKFTFGNSYKSGMGRLRTFEDGRRTGDAGTAVVGSFPAGASPYGILDMSGNVLQWTSSARRAGERLFRAVKGSCYLDGSSELARCTSIQYMPPESSEPYLGFRCVKDVE